MITLGLNMPQTDDKVMRSYASGATRDTNEGKLLFGKFLSPAVLEAYSKYMSMNRLQSDGNIRAGDNWKKGIEMDDYFDSFMRHMMDFWKEYYDIPTKDGMQAALCGIMFNTMGYYHELLKLDGPQDFDGDEPTEEIEERQRKFNVS